MDLGHTVDHPLSSWVLRVKSQPTARNFHSLLCCTCTIHHSCTFYLLHRSMLRKVCHTNFHSYLFHIIVKYTYMHLFLLIPSFPFILLTCGHLSLTMAMLSILVCHAAAGTSLTFEFLATRTLIRTQWCYDSY